MTSGVTISRVERRNQRRRKGEVRTSKACIRVTKRLEILALLAIQDEQPLRREGRNRKERSAPWGDRGVRVGQDRDDGRVQWNARENNRADRLQIARDRVRSANQNRNGTQY